ncbi:MAG: zinc ribbon domain-containing protein [Clostridiales bacterium]|nr:zinc ribbon domain-containing protein [Clostridiales bacterium]
MSTNKLLRCEMCGAYNTENSQYCEVCGSRITTNHATQNSDEKTGSTKNNCPNCGTQIDTESKFCGNCGVKIIASTKPQTSSKGSNSSKGFESTDEEMVSNQELTRRIEAYERRIAKLKMQDEEYYKKTHN